MKLQVAALLALVVVSCAKKAPTPGAVSTVALDEAISGTILPATHAYYQDVSSLPVHASSATYLASIGASASLHPNFGNTYNGNPIGYGYMAVGGTQAKVTLNFKAHPEVGGYTEPPYPNLSYTSPVPIPSNAYVLGGATTGIGDRVVIVYDRDNKIDYEFYRAFLQTDGSWDVISSARYDLTTGAMGNNGVSGSVAASGLPILAGLVRYDEVAAGQINHVIAMAVTQSQAGFIVPAWRSAGSGDHTATLPPMGLRLRLKAATDISTYSANMKVILTALKKYGAIVTDNGSSFFISGTYDTRWDTNDLATLRNIHGSDFEVVDTGGTVQPGN